jgi:hypothetical protein
MVMDNHHRSTCRSTALRRRASPSHQRRPPARLLGWTGCTRSLPLGWALGSESESGSAWGSELETESGSELETASGSELGLVSGWDSRSESASGLRPGLLSALEKRRVWSEIPSMTVPASGSESGSSH